jgi:hypothetical protein
MADIPNGKPDSPLSRRDKFLLHFLGTIIDKINTCYANIYAIQTILVNKGLVTKEDIIELSKDAKTMPQRRVGREALTQILQDLNVDHLAEMINFPSEKDSEKSSLKDDCKKVYWVGKQEITN